jgi:CO/xanthine dehydrogenase FAD-binding subunit
MATRIREYLRPTDWPGALKALRRPGVATRPLVVGPRPEALDAWEAEAVVDLSRLGLDYIREDEGTIRLGGLTPLQALAESPLLQSLANGILSQAAGLAGGLGLRHIASLAGALAPGQGPSDVHLALLALDATIVLRGDEVREVPLAEFQPHTLELVTEVRLSQSPGVYGSLQRVARTPRDQAIVAVAVALEVEEARGTCTRARVAVAGAGPEPMRLAEAEALLEGKGFSPSLLVTAERAAQAAANPTGDYRGSAEYRKSMAGVLVGRAIDCAWTEAGR